jgi:peptide/nickel transport system substrate-binding protein
VVALFAAVACRKPTPQPATSVVRIAVPYEFRTLDPHAEDKLSNFALLLNVYEPLVSMDSEMKVQPALASSWESPDPLTWVFHLRPAVRFHSGRPLRAADVVFSFGRLAGHAELEARSYVANVSEVHALDERTLQIKTLVPSRILLNKLANVLIVAEGATSEALRSSADGTGPYALAEWRPSERMALRRYDGYWGAVPAVRDVEFVLGRGPEEAIHGLLDGNYRLILGNSKRVEDVVGRSGRHAVLRRNNLYVKYLGFDVARDATPFCSIKPNPFRDVRVRRAIGMAIDRRRLVAALSTGASAATQPLPRFVFGFNPTIPEAIHDPSAAAALLEKAGFGSGFRVVLHARRILSEGAVLVRQDLERIGIAVEVRPVPDAEFFQQLSRRDASFWMNRFGCSTGDAGDFLENVVHSPDRERRFGAANYGGSVDHAVDEAIERSAGIEKPEERRNALQELLATIVGNQVLIPLYNDQDVYGIDRALSWQPRSDSYIKVADIAFGE